MGIILKLTLLLWQIDCDDVARNHMVKTETSVATASMGISEIWSWAFKIRLFGKHLKQALCPGRKSKCMKEGRREEREQRAYCRGKQLLFLFS